MEYKVSSFWAGRYAKTKHGYTNSLTTAIGWFIKWSVVEFVRVLKLNNYHYGNIFCYGKKLTNIYGQKQ